MSAKNTFTLTHHGELVQTFTSVHDVQAVRLGYRRSAGSDQDYWDAKLSPNGAIAFKPVVLRKMKTVAALKRDPIPSEYRTYADQTFVVLVRPGVTDIAEAEGVVVEGMH